MTMRKDAFKKTLKNLPLNKWLGRMRDFSWTFMIILGLFYICGLVEYSSLNMLVVQQLHLDQDI